MPKDEPRRKIPDGSVYIPPPFESFVERRKPSVF
jgi:hypothetical protein